MDPAKLRDAVKEPAYIIREAKGHSLRIADLARLSLRVFRVRPLRTFLTILGISIGIGTVLFLVSLGAGLQFILIGKLAATEDSLITLEAFYPQESDLVIRASDLEQIALLEESAELSPVAEFFGDAQMNDLLGRVLVRIVNQNYFRLSGTAPDLGSSLTDFEDSVIISNTALRIFGLPENEASLGNQLFMTNIAYEEESGSILPRYIDIDRPLVIRGIVVDELQPPFVFLPTTALSDADKPPFYARVLVKAQDIDAVEPLRDKLIEDKYVISARIDLVNQARNIMNVITIVLGVFGVTALVVSAIGMFNTMIIGFLERIFEVGIMKSIGATVGDIRNLFLMESLIMGLMGGMGGILVGVLGGEVFNLILNFLASRLGGKPIDLFIYPAEFIIFIIVLSGMVGILSGLWPARRAAQLSPKQAFLRR